MLKLRHSSYCAGAAIAACLVLGPTPSFAQAIDTTIIPVPEPVVATPATPPAPAAQPVMTSSPVVQQMPIETAPPVDAATPEPAPVTSSATVRRAPASPPAATRAPAAEPVAEPVETAAPVESTAVATAPQPAPAPVASAAQTVEPTGAEDAVAPTRTKDSTDTLLAILLGGLAVLALAIWGFVAIGRRKPVERVAAERTAPVATPAVPEPIVAAPRTGPRLAAVAPAPSLAHSGAAVALPRTRPDNFAERDTLLKQMVAAKPDRANPFTTPKARLRRARLILQSLGQDFGGRKPWIDLSQYSSNWPELSRTHYAAA